MIVVIADDLSGAAELAGIGLRYALDVEMSTAVNDSNADLLVIATDTRSMKEEDAMTEMEKVTSEVMLLHPKLIYKKVDSVLRGHVIAELKAQLRILDHERALVVAANPSLNRTISDGTFFYHDQPIHLSSFSNDPEFSIKTSNVLEMLRVNDTSVQLRKKDDKLSEHGIVVGEVTNSEDMKAWAKRIKKNILPAGASGFFTAILDTMHIKGNKEEEETASEELEQTTLFVCGTTFNKSRETIKEIKLNDGPVSYMPEEIVDLKAFDDELYQVWSNEIASFIHSKGKAIISIDAGSVEGKHVTAAMLREKTAIIVEEVLKQTRIHELFIEGGSTAAAVIRKLGFETFIPIEELGPGVVRMRVKDREDLCITVKPGSYEWPAKVWDFKY